ncbi:leucine-rich repeat domain-containing protein [Aureibaculum sp. A20]|uniref:Leucine-rich repeat domain-containing protein n=1 Tax=Aureibaculum flavum TaxID=2795986 RepID=A0ABS0WS58_9FLAO|nr:leucine-rich repeat domain-containing protein [Aureibaculum flavum]MBJ2174822.1 leucine-rich repeat domain-containing protein [Aureibaculum flavum]
MRVFLLFVIVLNVNLCFAQNKHKVFEYSEISPKTDKSKIYHLEIHGFYYKINELPTDIAEFKNLKSLTIKFQDSLTDITPLSNLTNLEKLTVSHCNGIESLKGIYNLKHLKNLNISFCELLTLPKKIKKITQLEHIRIGNLENEKHIKRIIPLKKLKSLDVYLNYKIPKAILKLKSLRKVRLSADSISDYESFKYLAQIDTLIFEQTKLDSIPKSFKYLKNLKYLDLHYSNNLTDLSNLKYTKQLEYLNLSSCDISEIPETFKEFKELKHLNISDNRKLSDYRSTEVLEHLTKLETLDISYSNISDIRPEILALKNLKSLKIGSVLQNFEGLEQLTNLTHLDLQENRGTGYMLPYEVSQLKKLKYLNLFDNDNLESLAGIENLSDLEELNLSFCPFESVPKYLIKLKKLKKLNLSFNKKIKRFDYLGKIEHLEELNIGFCNLKELPKEVYALKNLEILHFDYYKDGIDNKVFDDLKNIKEVYLNYSEDEAYVEIENLKKKYPNIKIHTFHRRAN